MRLPDVIAYEKKRLKSPWVWLPMMGLGTLLSAVVAVLLATRPTPCLTYTILSSITFCYGLSALYFCFSPLPWLWTRSRATHAPLLRGCLQSMGFNSLFLLAVTLVQILFPWPANLKYRLGLAMGTLGAAVLIHAPAAGLLGYFITLWERTRWVKEETEKKLREAHWILLRGQLSPHVLFNSLNGLAELVRQDPVAAEQAILDLSGLYRALLDHGSRPSSPLGEERRLVERYLAVEQLRLGTRLKAAWDWDESLDALETPPFLVQPMVENALKHGITPSVPGGEIRVSAGRTDQGIRLAVANTGKPLPLVLGSGVGMRNLEARLYLAYGDRARFHLGTENEWTVAEILLEGPMMKEHP